MSLSSLLLSCLFAGLAFSSPSRQLRPRVQSRAAVDTDLTACGKIITDVDEGYFLFEASFAFQCLTSVPFNEAVALRFIDYYNTTISFQSTLAYLKQPPPGYQQPAVDLQGGLQQIKDNVTAGLYANQYAFEADVQHLVYSAHDAHLSLYAGILDTFQFGSYYDIVTVSVDGKAVPEVYIADDIFQHQNGYTISPVSQINGEDVVSYLTRFAALNSVGMLEPHADWNQLMATPSQFILGTGNVFSTGATFYEGESLTFAFANGTALETTWDAMYTPDEFTGPLTTGGDYYNFFVLDLPPASIDEVDLPDVWNYTDVGTAGTASDNTSYQHGWDEYTGGVYPAADVVQANLSSVGWVTGYFFEDISTGVLSIPSFDESGFSVSTFSDAIGDFIAGAQNNSLSRVIIDLQGNSGGSILFAFTIFRQFFPGIDPFAGSRRRSHPLADLVGSTKTSYWSDLLSSDDLKETMAADEWVVTDRINAATGSNFSSWSEYFGPKTESGDLFSLVEQYDLADKIFDYDAFGGFTPAQYLEGQIPSGPGHWASEDVVILTDAQCSSACTLFVEMMTHQAGVRTVVMGGQPSPGPMQAASGTRGARSYDAGSLDVDFNDTTTFDPSTSSQIPIRDTGIAITYAGFNLRDQVRTADAPEAPLQFRYEAADCRLYFTLDNVFNASRLWRDAAAAAWDDPSRCVPGSTGFSSPGNATAANPPPQATAISPPLPAVQFDYNVDVYGESGLMSGTLQDGTSAAPTSIVRCGTGFAACTSGTYCVQVPVACGKDGTSLSTVEACAQQCTQGLSSCGSPTLYCDAQRGFVESRTNAKTTKPKRTVGKAQKGGFCVPTIGSTTLGCPVARN